MSVIRSMFVYAVFMHVHTIVVLLVTEYFSSFSLYACI